MVISRHKALRSVLLACLAFLKLAHGQSTDPTAFTVVREVTPGGKTMPPITAPFAEVDDRSAIEIVFDESKMTPPAPDATLAPVRITVEAFIVKDGATTPIAPINNYVSPMDSGDDRITYVKHIKSFDGPSGPMKVVPDTTLDLRTVNLAGIDHIEIRIKNLSTTETLTRLIKPQPFGFRPAATDSLFFLRRLGVDAQDEEAGIKDVNFGPAPGVTFGGTFLSRGNGFTRLLQPGIGVNVSFMNWDDAAFDVATGQFAAGTTSSNVNVGMGPQFSLFNNVLQFTVGWNLNVRTRRPYFGIGVGFIEIGRKIAGVLPGSE
jgi:hypothetical protein